ncbi:MAG: hypothetical protein EOP88_20735 [Verrucomicrobiaceae bacterium]|nr:MAG: hypothetical protein EOP88_20735 [Verrucomicrobiaceae bacterium]
MMLVAAGLLLVAVLVVLHGTGGDGLTVADGAGADEENVNVRSMGGPAARAEADAGKAQRMVELERLKKRWLDASDKAIMGEMDAEMCSLARDSAESLLCTPEMIRLINFLNDQEYPVAEILIDGAMEDLFAKAFTAEFAAEARDTLAALSAKVSPDHRWHVERWVLSAASACSETEFRDFLAALGSEDAKVSARLGWNVQVARTDPAAALAYCFKELESAGQNTMTVSALGRIIEDLPDGSDFAVLEQVVPVTGPLAEYRMSLFMKWARVDLAAASDYALHRPVHVEGGMAGIVNTLMNDSTEKAGEWVRTLPPGSPKDEAAVTLCNVISADTDVALEFAAMIQDAKLREEVEKEINLERSR